MWISLTEAEEGSIPLPKPFSPTPSEGAKGPGLGKTLSAQQLGWGLEVVEGEVDLASSYFPESYSIPAIKHT